MKLKKSWGLLAPGLLCVFVTMFTAKDQPPARKSRTPGIKIWPLILALSILPIRLWADPAPPLQGVLNVNEATLRQLKLLPGIGPKRAEAILARRQKRPFVSLRDLRAIKGLGPKRLKQLQPYDTFQGPSTLSHRVN